MNRLVNALLCHVVLVGTVLLSGCGGASPDEMLQEAMGLMQQQNFVAARHRLEELVKNHPDYDLAPEARVMIADCFNYEQRPDDATAVYKEIAVANKPGAATWKANFRLADMALMDKKFEEAEGYYRASIASVTQVELILQSMNSLGMAYQQNGQSDKALETFQEMLGKAEVVEHRMQVGTQILNLLIATGKKDEAWVMLQDLYSPEFNDEQREKYFHMILQAAPATRKYESAFQFFNTVVASATNEEIQAQASYFNGLLASSTAPYMATGVTVLKRVHEFFPKTFYGRWSEVDAAQVVLSATDQFPNATEEAKALLTSALDNYDDIINDMTVEWFEPRKAVWGYNQVSQIYEMRGMLFESLDDLKSASTTLAQIPAKFKSLPDISERARQRLELLSARIQIAEASGEAFWEKVRDYRSGVPVEATGEASAPAPEDVASATAASPSVVSSTQ